MRVWIVCFILLFGSAQLLEWMQKFSLPLPIFVLGGVFLAIASNYNQLADLPFHPDYEDPTLPTGNAASATPNRPPNIPSTTAAPAPSRSPNISFEISKTFNPKD